MFFMHFPMTFEFNLHQDKNLNRITLEDSDRPNWIVQRNNLSVLYSVIVIEIFDVNVGFAIYPMVYA